jgi:predicted aminopeptidase
MPGSIADSLKKLFQSPQDKERLKANKRRRIDYLKKKYGSHREEE